MLIRQYKGSCLLEMLSYEQVFFCVMDADSELTELPRAERDAYTTV